MKITSILLPAAAVGAALLFVVPQQQAEGFSLIGGSLSLGFRDVRVWNNFTDAVSNDNQADNPLFPGYYGATRAIWKGALEWGSVNHGSASGDPLQTELGSGGANFDFAFAGETNSAGGTNSNIVSVLSSNGGGVLAFVQTPISNGWTMKFYDGGINWADGPGTIGFTQYDIQSVACHEFGHALGLGHSGVNGATMAPSTGNGSEGPRSIANDDIAGLHQIYGAATNKVLISDVSVFNSQATITGTGFSSTGNEVWFTPDAPNLSASMTTVSNVSSSNGGTEIVVSIPSAAGPGDLMVKRQGSGGDDLSNAWPIDPTLNVCPQPLTYCVGKLSSNGQPSIMSYGGTNSISSGDFTLINFHGLPLKNGLFFRGSGQASIPFQGGTLCTNPPLARGPVTLADGLGLMSWSPSWEILNDFGVTYSYQAWVRDPQNPDGTGTGLSDAVEVFVCL